jgi:RHS repeat-associated protein
VRRRRNRRRKDKNGTVKWKRNIGGIAQITQTIVNGAVQSERTSYFHKDYLGSINAITDAVGSVVEEFSFDPWGARRAGTSVNMSRTAVLSNWWRNSNRTTLRGFTGHEMVDGVDVINMNGRIYDAYIGRFLQADPIVQEPALIDNLNRYSYVLNNPLNATDPSGYVLNKLVRNFAKDMSHIFGAEVTYVFGATVATYIGGPYGAAYWDYQFNRAMGATSSQAFRSSATTFAVASASYYIGAPGWEGYQKVFAHAVVGGLAAEAQGGDFVAGFFASGVAKGFSEAGGMARVSANGFTGVMTRTAIAAMIGGTVSEMTGGKFANGARTATLQHLFNYETERARAAQKGYSSDRGGWHDYTEGPNLVCAEDLGCTQQEMVDQFSRFAVPGQDPSKPVSDGGIYKVYDPRNGVYAGKVVTTVSADGMTITNTTLPGHVFHDGQITRALSQDVSGAWYVTTRGIGNNYVPFTSIGCDTCAAANSWQGRKIFNCVDSQMRMNIEAHHR